MSAPHVEDRLHFYDATEPVGLTHGPKLSPSLYWHVVVSIDRAILRSFTDICGTTYRIAFVKLCRAEPRVFNNIIFKPAGCTGPVTLSNAELWADPPIGVA